VGHEAYQAQEGRGEASAGVAIVLSDPYLCDSIPVTAQHHIVLTLVIRAPQQYGPVKRAGSNAAAIRAECHAQDITTMSC
jgi:hypothetical protein